MVSRWSRAFALELGFVVAFSSLSLPAAAAVQALNGNQHWLTVASTQDLDTAIGIAGVYAWKSSKVMKARNGWYAVVMGPYDADSLDDIVKIDPELTDLPKDALLSRGDNYVDTVWSESPDEKMPGFSTYKPGSPARFSQGSLSFEVTMEGNDETPGPTTLTGSDGGKQVFTFSSSDEYSAFEADAGVLKLDPDTDQPQLVAKRYTGGAHCCTATWIVTKPKGADAWTMVDAGTLDGNGVSFNDIDGDGTPEIVSTDNAFLYAFSSYAESFAPLRVEQLRGGTIKDVTATPEMRRSLLRSLGQMEFQAKLTPDLKSSPGYLAAWVAIKMLLGDGDAAWKVMERDVNESPDFGPEECTSGETVENCPPENLKHIPFPRALAEFLSDKDYGTLPEKARSYLK